STTKGKRGNAVKSSACWIWRPIGKVIDHISKDSGSYMPKRFDYVDPQGRLKHMTGNKSYLTDYQDIDGRFVTFAGSPKGEDYTAEPNISTANVPVSIVEPDISTASPEVKTAAESLVYIKRSAAKRKDKRKAIMKEVELVQKKTKLQLEQERLRLEEALRLQEQRDEEERQRIARVHEEASTFNAEEWDNIQAQIEADEELAQERERYFEA
ncbi:hypothetical protein Tco_0063678, partial [Tanacetum coccineum]